MDFLVFIPAISLIDMNPLSVAGTGWREYSFIILFQSVGAEEHAAASLGLLWLGVIVPRVCGGIIYVMQGINRKELEQEISQHENDIEQDDIGTDIPSTGKGAGGTGTRHRR